MVANGPGALLSLVNDTFYNEDTGDDGIDVYGDGGSSAVTLTNSIVEGFQDDLYDSGAGASITTGYDDWHSSASVSGAAPITRAGTDLDVTPDFVSAATGDFHLAAGAPLIDKGDPTPLSGAPATDFYGADRYVAGRGGCSYIVDIGAAEYQVTTPTAVATAPQTASAGVPVAFSGAGSCGPDAASPISSYSWSFGDGAAGAGASVEHAFVMPGIKTVTLTVADAAGGTATRTVTVDVGAPIVTLLGLGRGTRARRPVILFGLSAAGSVRFTLGEWVGAREIRGKCEVPRPYRARLAALPGPQTNGQLHARRRHGQPQLRAPARTSPPVAQRRSLHAAGNRVAQHSQIGRRRYRLHDPVGEAQQEAMMRLADGDSACRFARPGCYPDT